VFRKNRSCSIDIATTLWLGQSRNRGSSPDKIFSVLRNDQSSSEACRVPYAMVPGVLSTE
jgi:hypothetical protein